MEKESARVPLSAVKRGLFSIQQAQEGDLFQVSQAVLYFERVGIALQLDSRAVKHPLQHLQRPW